MSVAVGTKYPVKVTSGIDWGDPEGSHTGYAEESAGSQAAEDADGQENGQAGDQAAEDAEEQPKSQADTQDEKSDVKTGKKNKK